MESGWEGCLSVPGLRGMVSRNTRLRYQGVDQFGNVIDPLVIDKTIDKYRKGKRTLGAAAERYNVSLANAHTARDDAIAAGHVGLGMLRFFRAQDQPVVPFPSSAQDLHDLQVKWADAIEASYAKWRQTDVPDYKPIFGWPVKEFS
jgi:DNA polymerase-3 subunit epsilon